MNFKGSLNNFRVKYGSFTAIMTTGVIAVVVILNMIIGSLDLKFDLTKDKRYSISDETIEILQKLDRDVTLYTVYETGKEEATFVEILDKYKLYSSHIKIANIDPYNSPTKLAKYSAADEQITLGSVIVECGDRFKLVNSYDLIGTDFDYNTLQEVASSIDIEPKVTAAISYVASANTPIFYVLTGHSEIELPATLSNAITDANFELKELNLLTEDIPEDCSALLINGPQIDIGTDETEKIKAYLQNQGRAIIAMDVTNQPTPNLNSIATAYGVEPTGYVVVEGDNGYMWSAEQAFIIAPNVNETEITTSLVEKNYRVLLGLAQAFNVMELKNRTTEIEPLLTTSSKAYAKTNSESETLGKEDTDLEGPFSPAIAVTDSWYSGESTQTTKIVFYATSTITTETLNQAVSGHNTELYISSMNWLIDDKEESVYIAPKSLTREYLTIDAGQKIIIGLISYIIIPLALFVTGFVIWLRRRNR